MLLVALAAVNAAPVGEERHEEVPHKRDADEDDEASEDDDEEGEDRLPSAVEGKCLNYSSH